MNVMVKFKDLIITDAISIEQVEKLIKKRNPDVEIDEIYEYEGTVPKPLWK